MSLFNKNQNNKERIIRLIIGLLFSIPFFTHGYQFSYLLLFIGSVLIFNAFSGVCLIYKVFGYSSCKFDSNWK